jgi:hypothetical protein
MGLQQFEQRLERLVAGVLAGAFGGSVQPLEIGRRIAREMDLTRTMGVHGLIAPNHFVVRLAARDFERFDGFHEALARELEEAAREHARSERYVLVGPVQVELMADFSLKAGRFEVDARVVEGPEGVPVASLVLPDGRRVPIGTEPLVLGRLPECSVVLADPNVSRRHAEVRRRGDSVSIVDLNSTNGTSVNGVRVREQVLHDGDEITLGTTTIRFETA